MSFLNYLDNKQDFLTNKDLLDLIDINLLSKEEKERFKEYKMKKKYLTMSKSPIYYPRDCDEDILNDVILFKECSYSSSDKYILFDRISNSIIYYAPLKYTFYDYEFDIFNKDLSKHLLDFIKNQLDCFNIYYYSNLLESCQNFINDKEKELFGENYSHIYEEGKKQIKDFEELDKEIANNLKHLYIYDEKIEEEEFSYIYGMSSVFSYMKEKNEFFIIKYLRDKDYILRLVEEEFYKEIQSKNKNKYTSERFYRFERKKELQKELIKSFENDKELNMYKAIYKAHSLAGKTININGTKYENHVSKPYNKDIIDNIEIGRYSDCIKFKDIKKITFGKKVLFDITNY